MYDTLIDANRLQALLASGQPCVVFDCSFDLSRPEAADEQFQSVHIAGAVQAHLERDLSALSPAEAINGGRHPLPSPQRLAAWLGRMGLANGMQAVVYDRQGANYCGRLWWLLKWVGHEAVAVLDGGLQAWETAQGPVATGPAVPREPVVFTAGTALARLATTADVAARLGRPGQTLIDARGTPRFRGEIEPLDPVAGHIPGALNRPFAANFGPDGRFKPPAELRAEFEALLAGRDPASVVHHCGSGVSAVPNVLAMELAGLGRQALYAGSWSEWCTTPGLPCAQG